MKINLKDLTYNELCQLVADMGEAKFRAKQIFEWLYRGVESFDEMSNLSKSLREKLAEKTYITSLKIEEKYWGKLYPNVMCTECFKKPCECDSLFYELKKCLIIVKD